MKRFILFPALLLPLVGAAPSGAEEASFDPIVFELQNGNGVDFVTNSSRTDHRHQPETMVSGVALFDYDNDGFLDIYVVNGAKMTELDKTDPVYWNRLYHNKGDGTFEDVTEAAGVKGDHYDLAHFSRANGLPGLWVRDLHDGGLQEAHRHPPLSVIRQKA